MPGGNGFRFGLMELISVSTIVVTIAGGTYLFGGKIEAVGGDVRSLEGRVSANTKSIERVERQVKEDQDVLLRHLERTESEVRAVRSESAAGQQRLEDKLDSLIQRLMDQPGR